jgi:hypothetical protein
MSAGHEEVVGTGAKAEEIAFTTGAPVAFAAGSAELEDGAPGAVATTPEESVAFPEPGPQETSRSSEPMRAVKREPPPRGDRRISSRARTSQSYTTINNGVNGRRASTSCVR